MQVSINVLIKTNKILMHMAIVLLGQLAYLLTLDRPTL